MLSGIQVALDKNELKNGGSFQRTRFLAEVGHQCGLCTFGVVEIRIWEIGKRGLNSQWQKNLEMVKHALDSIPGSSEKVRGDHNRAPAVFGTVVADSNQ